MTKENTTPDQDAPDRMNNPLPGHDPLPGAMMPMDEQEALVPEKKF